MKILFTQYRRLSCWFVTLMLLSSVVMAQSSPADCKTGCTSNDVQIKTAYLSDINGNILPNTFVCPAIGNANVFLTLELTTKTPRVGVVIYLKVKNFTPPNTIGMEVATITECFGIALNQPLNKVTFQNPFNWTCGNPIVLTDVFIGWGTGNTNFCTGSGFQCPATSSKCYSLPNGQYIPIQTPTANTASASECSTQPNGSTAVFDLTSLENTVKGSQTNVTVTWYTDMALNNQILTPAAHTSATGKVYAKVTSNISPNPYSISEVSLTVKPTPTAPTLSKLDNCNGTTTVTASGLVNGASLTWSDGGSGNPRTVSSTTALTVTQTVNGCTSAASNSVTPAPKTTPLAPVLSKVDNCDGTTSITAKDGNGVNISSSELTWSNGSTGNPISVTTTTQVTATRTVNGCTSPSSNSITPDPGTAPSAPNLTKVDNCDGTTTITAKDGNGVNISNSELTWSNDAAGNPITVNTTTPVTATRTLDGCTSGNSNTVTPAPKSTPSFTVCIVQPTLCANSGSVTFSASGGTGLQYSINGGTTYQAGNVFSNLSSGSVSSLKVKNAEGCESALTTCDNISSTCGEAITSVNRNTQNDLQESRTITQHIEMPGNDASIKAYPNPYNDRIRFVVNTPENGFGSLEVHNLLGQKVKTVFQGQFAQGTQVFDMEVPAAQRSTLIYVLRVNGKQVSGKMLQSPL